MHVVVQALHKLGEPKAVLKVRQADLPLLKEVLEPVKSKFSEVRHSIPVRDITFFWSTEESLNAVIAFASSQSACSCSPCTFLQ